MKHRLSLLSILLLAIPLSVKAYDVSYTYQGQTLYYEISGSNVTVTYPGSSFGDYNGYTKPTGSLEIPASVTNGGTTYSVIAIGSFAFRNCSGLTEITCLATTAPTLGYGVFSGVASTIPVNIPSGSLASYQAEWSYFSNFVEMGNTPAGGQSIRTCTGQTLLFAVDNNAHTATVTGYVAPCEGALIVPPYFEVDGVRYTVTAIGDGAFQNCTGLVTVTLPASITTVGENAFTGCTNLQDVKMW